MEKLSLAAVCFILIVSCTKEPDSKSRINTDSTTKDFQFIKNQIEDTYVELWTKGKGDPFDISLADSLYMNSENFVSIDTDMYSVSDSLPTRTVGYSNFRPFWEPVWSNIQSGGLKSIYNLSIEINKDWALVTFDAHGEGTSIDLFP